MHEMLYVASGLRLPVVMANVNRAISSPINIHADHGDSMAARDAGWIQLSCVDAQDAYDTTIMAFRIAEEMLLPVMVLLDGFVISHTLQNVSLLDDSGVLGFVGRERKTDENILDPSAPKTLGALVLPDYYYEMKMQQVEAMGRAKGIIEKTFDDFEKMSSRRYDLIESYKAEDAEYTLVCMGSVFGTAKSVVDSLRDEGKRVGILRVKSYRPFAGSELREMLSGNVSVGVMDRAPPFGSYPPLFLDVCSYCRDMDLKSYVYGLGGRDTDKNLVREVFEDLMKNKTHEGVEFMGVRK